MDILTDRLFDDVLIVEDDPIIALGFEDTIVGYGVSTIRSASSVSRALKMIEERAPEFALLDRMHRIAGGRLKHLGQEAIGISRKHVA